MVEKLLPLPDVGLPPVAVHANVYGAVPPVAEAVHDTAVPTVPVAGQLTVAASASGLIVTVACVVAVLWVGLAESVAVTLMVLLPLLL